MTVSTQIADGFRLELNDTDLCNFIFSFFGDKVTYPCRAESLRLLGRALEKHQNVEIIGVYKEVIYRKYYKNQNLFSIITTFPGRQPWESLGFTEEDWKAIITFLNKYPGDPIEISRHQIIIKGILGLPLFK